MPQTLWKVLLQAAATAWRLHHRPLPLPPFALSAHIRYHVGTAQQSKQSSTVGGCPGPPFFPPAAVPTAEANINRGGYPVQSSQCSVRRRQPGTPGLLSSRQQKKERRRGIERDGQQQTHSNKEGQGPK